MVAIDAIIRDVDLVMLAVPPRLVGVALRRECPSVCPISKRGIRWRPLKWQEAMKRLANACHATPHPKGRGLNMPILKTKTRPSNVRHCPPCEVIPSRHWVCWDIAVGRTRQLGHGPDRNQSSVEHARCSRTIYMSLWVYVTIIFVDSNDLFIYL